VHTIFHTVRVTTVGLIRADIPEWSSIDPAALLLSAGALVAMLRFKLGMGWTLFGSAVLGAVWVYSSN
jgi:chromate transporter